jgi:hypothetical protein
MVIGFSQGTEVAARGRSFMGQTRFDVFTLFPGSLFIGDLMESRYIKDESTKKSL